VVQNGLRLFKVVQGCSSLFKVFYGSLTTLNHV